MSKNEVFNQQRIAEILEENRLLKELHAHGTDPEIIIYVAPYAPQIVIAVSKTENVVLSPNTNNNTASIPYDVYLKLKRQTKWFELGYLYTDKEEDLDNSNLILNIREWIRSRTEAQIRKDIEKITSEGTLNALYEYTEEVLHRQTDERRKTGKILVVRQETLEKISDISGYSLMEDSPE